jgi:hypothetical protein
VSLSDGYLKMNFDDALVAAYREIKMLKALGKNDIPQVAQDFFDNSEALWVNYLHKFLHPNKFILFFFLFHLFM